MTRILSDVAVQQEALTLEELGISTLDERGKMKMVLAESMKTFNFHENAPHVEFMLILRPVVMVMETSFTTLIFHYKILKLMHPCKLHHVPNHLSIDKFIYYFKELHYLWNFIIYKVSSKLFGQ